MPLLIKGLKIFNYPHYKNIKKKPSFPKKCYCKSVSTVLSPLIHHKMCIFALGINIIIYKTE